MLIAFVLCSCLWNAQWSESEIKYYLSIYLSIASCFRIIGLILSGPPALCGFKFCSNLRIHGSFTCISGISWYSMDLGLCFELRQTEVGLILG